MCLLLSIELLRLGVFGLAMDKSGLQALRHAPLAHPSDRRTADLQSVGDLHIGPSFAGSIFAFVSLQEDTCMGELACRGAGAVDQALQFATVRFTGLFLFLGMGMSPCV